MATRSRATSHKNKNEHEDARKERPLNPVILKIADKIVREYQPEKIILFGSHAWGTPGPDSDVDLLVVKESNEPRFERTLALRRQLFPPIAPTDLLVYTSGELQNAIERKRNLFLEDVVAHGRTIYDAHRTR